MRKINNYYLIIKEDNKYYDFTQESFGTYNIFETNEDSLTQAKDDEYTHHKIKDIDIYIIVEPMSDGITNAVNNKVRLLRNLPKKYNSLTKYDVEKVINEIKKK